MKILLPKTNFLFLSTFLLFFIFNSNSVAQCPDIQIVDMRGVAGFAQTDDLAKCGQPDTLAFLVFTDDPGDISGMEMTINLGDGLIYAGQETTHFGGATMISNVDPNPSSPSFLLEGVTGGGIFVGYVLVMTNCDADLDVDMLVDFEYDFVFTPPAGSAMVCDGTFEIEETFNNALTEPVINIRSITPPEANLASLGNPFCQRIQISQDGLGTYLDSLDFKLCGLVDGGDVFLVSTSVNGLPITSVYNALDTTYHLAIDNSYFPDNGSPNPSDMTFNTDETMEVEFCYQVDDCTPINNLPISYKAQYGCGGNVCQITQMNSFILVEPIGAVMPTATVDMIGNAEICGNPSVLNLTITNPNPNTNQFMMMDVSVGFNTCVKSNLGIADVLVGGVSLDPMFYKWEGADIFINFDSVTVDPDGGMGLVDFDGDGFFDDLPGGEIITVQILLEMECGTDANSCATVDCGFAQFFVEGTINCGTPFKNFPAVTGGDLIYSPTSDTTNLEALGDNIGGTPMYNFGTYGGGASGSNGPTKKTKVVEYCYTFNATNVSACPSTPEVFFQLSFSANPLIALDIDFEPGTAMFDDGTGYAVVPDAMVDVVQVDQATKLIQINAGSPVSGTQLCYKLTVAVDSSECSPVQYFSGNMKVIESCSDCAGGCEIVKACRSELFAGDPNATDCVCMFEQVESRIERKNIGYTDKSLTTKVDRATVPPADLVRLMPCDTIEGEEKWVVNDMEFFNESAWWSWGKFSTGAGSFERSMNEAELQMDARNSRLLKWQLLKADGSVVDIDLTTIPSCVSDFSKSTSLNSRSPITNYWGDAPMIGDALQSYKPGLSSGSGAIGGAEATGTCLKYNSYDGRDNKYFGFTLYNSTNYQVDCKGGVEAGRSAVIEGGNCLQDFLDAYGVAATDTFYFKWDSPVMKNPALQARLKIEAEGLEPAGFNPVVVDHNLRVSFIVNTYRINPYSSTCYTYFEGGCGEQPLLQTTCPGEITVKSELNLDDCGGDAKHVFTFDGVIPNGWFSSEYRPLMDITDVTVPVYNPSAYCGNATLTDITGTAIPMSVDTVFNGACTTSNGNDVCGITSGDHMEVKFDFINAGNKSFVVGMGLVQDSVILTYDLCMVCPDIAPILGYEVVTNYQYICGEPDPCPYLANVTNLIPNTPTLHPERYLLVDAAGDPYSGNWYTTHLGDTLQQKRDTSIDVTLNDNRNGRTGLTVTNDSGTNLLASGSPGVSVEYVDIEVCAVPPAPAGGIMGVMNLQGSITLPSSVSLIEVLDSPGGAPLVFTLVSGPDDMGFSTYSVQLTDLTEGECTIISIGTTLLFCPEVPAPAPQICANFSSNCSPVDVQDAIAAVAGVGAPCTGAGVCYSYIFGEAGLQTEWFLPDPLAGDPQLCDEIEFAFRVKNVKDLTLVDLLVMIDLPTGLEIISNSWEISYPGNTVLNWSTIVDPDVVTGNHYEYSDDNLFNGYIDANGLPGISSGLDSNFVAFKFKATTVCDDFLSGSILKTETEASDPCGPISLTTGSVESDPVILQGADPADFAQLLIIANPDVIYCGGEMNEFGVSAINISEFPTADSVTICLTIPSQLTYQSGSIFFTAPTYTPNNIVETVVGGDLEVCFDAPMLNVGEKYSFKFTAAQNEDAACGGIEIGADIKSFVPGVLCTSTGGLCGVNVQNSINPSFNVDLGPPLETLDIKLIRECTSTNDPVRLCYEVMLKNPSAVDYMGITRVGIHQDVTENGVLDIIDPELAGMDHALNVLAGDTVTIMMCLDVPEAQSCPVIVVQTYETACACDMTETPFNSIPPSFMADLGETYGLCPSQPLGLEVCAGYEFTLEPAEGGTITIAAGGDSVYVALFAGFGEDSPVTFTASNTIGTCNEDYSVDLTSLGSFVFGPYTAELCSGECTDLDLNLPSNIANAVQSIIWSPAIGLDDTSIEDPEVCNLVANQQYLVTLIFNDMCMLTTTYDVLLLPSGTISIENGAGICFDENNPNSLVADVGFDSYVWYKVISGPPLIELIVSSGSSNVYTPTEPGDYFVKAMISTDPCPAVSSITPVNADFCVDLALKKEITPGTIPPYPIVGDVVQYRLRIYNQGGVTIDSIEVTDSVPPGLINNDGNWSPSGPLVSGTTVVRTVTGVNLVAGDSLDIFINLTIAPGANLMNTTNIAEISAMGDDMGNDVSDQDIDSTPDGNLINDPGGAPDSPSDNSVDGDGLNGGGANGDMDPLTDEDDNDPATLPIVDLALLKDTEEMGPFIYGDTITFFIAVTNQGNVDANNILVTDYIPAGFDYATSSAHVWTGGTSGPVDVTHTIMDTLLAGETDTLYIDLIVKAVSPTSMEMDWTNVAEITSMEDLDGFDITMVDIDSNADGTNGNDGGGNPNSGSDDVIDGDGTGNPGDVDGNTDEDDSDPEMIQVYDLALIKETMTITGMAYGDTVEYMITIENQGNVPATNIEITDYYPCGLVYLAGLNDPIGWTDNGTVATITLTDTLLAGETTTVSYYLTIQACSMPNAFVNYSEISMSQDTLGNSTDGTGPNGGITDADSTPDNDNTNDAGGDPGSDADNYTDGNGTGVPGDGVDLTDEDDHDPALIQVIDIALTKSLIPGQGPFSYGSPIDFAIQVINQGNVDLYDIEITDYIAAGFEYDIINDLNGWTLNGSEATTTIAGPMIMWDTVNLVITLIPQAVIPSDDPTAWTNEAEVSQMFDVDGNDISGDDIDSQADNDNTNDSGGSAGTDSDDSVDGDGTNGGGNPDDSNADSDEDDADPALVPIFDLALTKQFVYPDSIYLFGDEIEFLITLHNQGNQPVTNIEVTEYIPASLTEVGATNGPNWSFAGGLGTYAYGDTLWAGTSDTIYLNMIFQIAGGIEDYINYAEISEFADTSGNNSTDNPDIVSDADSDPDAINGNDAGGYVDSGSDDSINGDGSGSPGDTDPFTDEDDHDPLQLGYVDLALTKVANTQQVLANGEITFTITVINQGTIPVGSITITDYIPVGMSLADTDWTAGTAGSTGMSASIELSTANGYLPAGGLAEMESVQVEITLMVNSTTLQGAYVNYAEITEILSTGGDDMTDADIDSDGDDDDSNDSGGIPEGDSDDTVDGDGSGTTGDDDPTTDEDDHDPAAFCVTPNPEIIGDASVCPGDTVTYTVRPYNPVNTYQWGVDATGAVITQSDSTITIAWSETPGGSYQVSVHEYTAFSFCHGIGFINVTIEGDVPLTCNSGLNVSLNGNCEIILTADILLEGPSYPDDSYTIVIVDENGNTLPSNVIDGSYIGQQLEVSVVHDCTGNSCWGYITVEDKLPPVIICPPSDTLSCDEYASFQIPATVIEGGGCGDESFEVETEEYVGECEDEFAYTFVITTIATDASGNASVPCIYAIYVEKESIDSISFPVNYDGLPGNEEVLSCSGGYAVDSDGHPSPSETGVPGGVTSCINVTYTYTDVVLPICETTCATNEASYKVLRKWLVVEWCTSTLLEHTQVIKVMDTLAPVIAEIADMTVSTDVWGCGATIELPSVNAEDNCSSTESITYSYSSSAGTQVGNTFVLSDPAKTMPGAAVVITVTASDCCGNSSSTDFEVTVVDLIPPVVVAETSHTVSLTSNGTAKVHAEDFDDGSHDGCGPIGFSVKRMDNGSPCQSFDEFPPAGNDNGQFNEAVFFCCADANGGPVMVQFQVCDDANMDGIIGNDGDNCNIAMVEVYVQDKLAPVIICPDPMTISCIDVAGIDFSDTDLLDELFGTAVAGATCNVEITQTAIGNEDCGAGVVIRNFTATTSAGSSSCQQLITVLAAAENVLSCERISFTGLNNNIYNWCAVNDNSNDPDDDLPAISIDCADGFDIPELAIDINGLCTEAGVSIEVDTFDFAGGACKKYLIHYEVIDQCVFDENYVDPVTGEIDPYNSSNGYFEFILEVDAFDTDEPVATCEDVSYVAETCEGGNPTIIPSATDNCTDPAYFGYLWRLDMNNDNTIDFPASGWHASSSVTAGQAGYTDFPIGTHRIFWIISDGCGNDATCSQLVTITGNEKQPTPYCHDGLSVAVMPSSGTVSLWANDFDAGSYDNCAGDLILSMIPELDVAGLDADEAYAESFAHANVTQQANGDWGYMFSCTHIPNGVSAMLEVRMYVTDADGNYDYCTASLRLDDNFDACADNVTGELTISGVFKTEEGEHVELVDVELNASFPEFPMSELTLEDGLYSFDGLNEHVDYEVRPNRNDNHLNGITTLDIVMIQKHILGIDAIASPYKMIAADVNSDCKVTGTDLIQLRKLILGKYVNDELPDNSSWRFVRDEYEFIGGVQPCGYEEISELQNLSTSVEEDYVSVKIGDINGSNEANLIGGAETRTDRSLYFEIEDESVRPTNTKEIAFLAKDFTEVYGYQFTLELEGMTFLNMKAGALTVSESNVGIHRAGLITTSFASGESISVSDDEVLFTIEVRIDKGGRLSEMMKITSLSTRAEAYQTSNLEIIDTKLGFRTASGGSVVAGVFTLYQNEPNPFNETTVIRFDLPESSEATITVYDGSGKVLYTKISGYASGENTIELDRSEIKGTGVLYYKIEAGEYVATKKMIILD